MLFKLSLTSVLRFIFDPTFDPTMSSRRHKTRLCPYDGAIQEVATTAWCSSKLFILGWVGDQEFWDSVRSLLS